MAVFHPGDAGENEIVKEDCVFAAMVAWGSWVTVNSDAHRAPEIARDRDIAWDILIKAGFNLPEQLFKAETRSKEKLSLYNLI